MNTQFMICPYCKEEDECFEFGKGNWVCDQCFSEQEEEDAEEDED